MKYLLIACLLLGSLNVLAEDQDTPGDDADNNLCAAVDDLVHATKNLQNERRMEKASGVVNLYQKRVFTEIWVDAMNSLKEAVNDKNLTGAITNFSQDCIGISESDENAMNKEVQSYQKKMKE